MFVEEDLVVGMVWENSPASESGVEPGDAIVSINGITSKGVPRDKWCEIVDIFSKEEAAAPLPVTIRTKSGEEKQLVLEKIDLFNP